MSDSLAPEDEPLDAETLLDFAERIEGLPPETAAWVGPLFQECLRARLREAELVADAATPSADAPVPGRHQNQDSDCDAELAQVALDVAEWLKTLWDVGYMGAGSFPAAPRSAFPRIELDDVFQSALFARIRQGKRPLPFPPPTRHGRPWHALIEDERFAGSVAAEPVHDADGRLLGVQIEADNGWQFVDTGATSDASTTIVQHRGRGPLFRLELSPTTSRLTRLPAQHHQPIRLRERGGIRSFSLEWSLSGAKPIAVPLRAATWERAESEAAHWIATQHPALYGRVAFLRADDTTP